MTAEDMELIYSYLNGTLDEHEVIFFEEKMSDDEFCSEFLKFIEDEELIQRVLSEIGTSETAVKPVRNFFRKSILLSAAAALMVIGYIFYEMNNFQAFLTGYEGVVKIDRNGTVVEPGKELKIRAGDVLATGNGSCTLTYKDKTTLRLDPNSKLVIEIEHGAKLVKLISGSLSSTVTPQKKGKRMEVRAAAGSAFIIGTKFSVSAPESCVKLDVSKGIVLLRNNTGSESFVEEGEYAIARDNLPIKVLKTPVRSEIVDEEERFYKWLSYSTKLRNDKDLIAYYDFQGLSDSPGILLNRSVATKSQPLNGKAFKAVPVKGRWSLKEALYVQEGGFIDCGRNPLFNQPGPMTVFLWLRSKEFTKYQETFISKGDTSWRLARYKLTEGVEAAFSGLKPNQWTVGEKRIDDDKWHMITGVYDGEKISVYIDGRLESIADAKGSTSLNDDPVMIGKNTKYSDRNFTGWLDEAGILKRAMSPEEVQELYRNGTP